jgi:hypothetical protein
MDIGARLTFGKRRAVSGIIAGLILFVMLFTVGTGYFLWVNVNNGSYSQALAGRGNAIQEQQLENLLVFTGQGGSGGNDIVFYVTNSGGVSVNVTNLFVTFPAGVAPSCGSPVGRVCEYGVGAGIPNTSPGLWQAVSQGGNSLTIDTRIPIVSGMIYVLKVLTQRGNTFSQTYPMPVPPFSSSAGSANTSPIGFIELDFNLFQAWSVTCSGTKDPASGGCTVNSFPANYNNPVGQNLGSRYSGYTVSSASIGSNWLMFSLNITNADPFSRTITLTPSSDVSHSGSTTDASSLVQFSPPGVGIGGGSASSAVFILGGVCGVTKAVSLCPSGISYGQTLPPANVVLQPCSFSPPLCHPTIVFFYAPSVQGPSIPVSVPQKGGGPNNVIVANSLYLYGTPSSGGGISPKLGTPCYPAACAYGQNLPFTTTVYTP